MEKGVTVSTEDATGRSQTADVEEEAVTATMESDEVRVAADSSDAVLVNKVEAMQLTTGKNNSDEKDVGAMTKESADSSMKPSDVEAPNDWMYDESNSSAVYEEVRLEEMEWDEEEEAYFYPCPCGDQFIMPIEDLEDGEDIALCPSCSLRIRVLYDPNQFE